LRCPLFENEEGHPLLVEYFLDLYARKAGKHLRMSRREHFKYFSSYPWPGNIRELQNVIERSVILCETDILLDRRSWLPPPPTATESNATFELPRRLEAQEKNIIEEALKASRGLYLEPQGRGLIGRFAKVEKNCGTVCGAMFSDKSCNARKRAFSAVVSY